MNSMRIGLTAKMIGVSLVVVAMLSVGLTGIGHAITIDFSTVTPTGNDEVIRSFVVNSDLTLRAMFKIPDGEGQPASELADSFTAGYEGSVYFGDLGNLNAQENADNCDNVNGNSGKNPNCGVGVRGIDLSKNKATGSKGNSGEGGNQDESLIFDFTNDNVPSDSIVLDFVGTNDLILPTGCNSNTNPKDDPNACPDKNDVIGLQIDFIDGSGIVYATVNQFIANPGATFVGTLTFSDLPSIVGTTADRFAVRAIEGHFGVLGLSYDVTSGATTVPEPSSLMLLGSGLAGLGFFRRKNKKRVQRVQS